jgi:hypothetical protein
MKQGHDFWSRERAHDGHAHEHPYDGAPCGFHDEVSCAPSGQVLLGETAETASPPRSPFDVHHIARIEREQRITNGQRTETRDALA